MTTTRTEPSALEDLKVKQQKIWSSGDYGRIAWITVPLAHELAEAVELRPGASVLDVACGTGHVALEAARTLCEVTGVDYVPELIEVARRRAEAEALEADFRVGDAEALPFADGSFDLALSDHGAMSWGDPDRTLPEAARVLRPGGWLVFCLTSPLFAVCWDDALDAPGERLRRDYFGQHAHDEGDGAATFNLPYGEWVRRFRAHRLAVEALVEPRPPPGATSTFWGSGTDWARRWPAELVWKLRRE
jgi:SAM-dependent methyltransferase